MHDDLLDPAVAEFDVLQECRFYTEGPAVDEYGNVYYTDLAGAHIWRHNNGLSERWSRGLRPNGQRILDDGSHLICDSAAKCVTHYNRVGKIITRYGPGRN